MSSRTRLGPRRSPAWPNEDGPGFANHGRHCVNGIEGGKIWIPVAPEFDASELGGSSVYSVPSVVESQIPLGARGLSHGRTNRPSAIGNHSVLRG